MHTVKFIILTFCWVIQFVLPGAIARGKNVFVQDTSVVSIYDVSPQFPGGMPEWQKFVQHNLNLNKIVATMDSTTYVNYGVRQRADLEFTICENGEVCDVEIRNKNHISPEFAQEALRIMKRSPKWEPATVQGRPVRVRIVQSITLIMPE